MYMVHKKARQRSRIEKVFVKKNYAGPQLTFFFNLQQQQQQTLNMWCAQRKYFN